MHLSLVRGGRMASNKDLNKANKAKKDEFYTMLADIEVELKHYRKHFKGKTAPADYAAGAKSLTAERRHLSSYAD